LNIDNMVTAREGEICRTHDSTKPARDLFKEGERKMNTKADLTKLLSETKAILRDQLLLTNDKVREIAALRYDLLAARTAKYDADNAVTNLKERVRELESQVANWKSTAGIEADGLESWKGNALRLGAENTLLREALDKIVLQAENKASEEQVRVALRMCHRIASWAIKDSKAALGQKEA